MRHSFISAAFLALVSSVFAQATPGFDVISSPTQDETAAVGSVLNIVWAPAGVTGTVTIVLLEGDSTSSLQLGPTIASGINNTLGAYAWSIPASVGAFSTYGFKIQLDSDINTFQYSFPFQITGGASSSNSSSVSGSTSAPASTITIQLAPGTAYINSSTPSTTVTTTSTSSTPVVPTTASSNLTLSTTPTTTSGSSSGSSSSATATHSSNAAVGNIASGGMAMLGGLAIALFL